MMNMSRFSRIFILAAVAFAAAACGRTASIKGSLSGSKSSEVVVKLLNINKMEVLDTVSVNEKGEFACKVKATKGQPEFVYLFDADVKIASLILQGGDRVYVQVDSLGDYTVSGCDESAKFAQVERDYAAALSRLTDLSEKVAETDDVQEAVALRQRLAQEYIDYYRDRVRFVLENSSSMAVVPVLFQNFGSGLPVFGQPTDAIHFRNAADSLELLYPDSRYVKALRQEADKRFGYLELNHRIGNAEQIGFPEIELPDIKGEKRKLSEVDSKVILIHFWSAAQAEHNRFNIDVLKPLYEDFHDKGFEIYQVSLDVDKGLWAQVVKQQGHPWVSVCDSRGAASPYAVTYNIQALPAIYIISDGALVDGGVVDEASLRKLLSKLL